MDVIAEAQAAADFGSFHIDFRRRTLSKVDDTGAHIPIAIGTRAFDILALLVNRFGKLVTKTDIMDAVWAGLAVEDSNVTVQISALRRALDEGDESLSCIQTIPGRGYRLVPEVTRVGEILPRLAPAPFIDNVTSSPSPVVATVNRRLARWRRWKYRGVIFFALAGLLIVVAIAALMMNTMWGSALPQMSVAVRSFAAPTDNPAISRLADALSENLTMDLSQLWVFSVAAHQAIPQLGNQAFDATLTGRTLGVRYLVEGSVRTVGNRIEVHTDLISVETGKTLWINQTSLPDTDLATAQIYAGSWLQNAIGNTVIAIEAARGAHERPYNPDATDLTLQGRVLLEQASTRARLTEARALFERALRTDPNAYRTMAFLVDTIITNETDLGDGVTEHDIREAEGLIAKAEALAPTDPSVLYAQAYLLRLERRWPEAEAAFGHLLSLYPHFYRGGFELGVCRLYTGRAAEAVPLFEQALATSAGKGDLFSRYIRLGEALLLAGQTDEAVPWLRKAEIADPGRTPASRAEPYLLVASALALSGQIDAAHAEMAQSVAIFPYVSAASFWGMNIGTDAFITQLDRIRHGLVLAGLQLHVDEAAAGASAPPSELPSQLAGLTPQIAAGATVINTAATSKIVADQNPVILDGELGQVSVPGAISLPWISRGGSITDNMQSELDRLLNGLTHGDKTRPIIVLGLNAYHWPGYNLARRASALGYQNVFWYRGGRDAWAAAGLPMATPRVDPLMTP